MSNATRDRLGIPSVRAAHSSGAWRSSGRRRSSPDFRAEATPARRRPISEGGGREPRRTGSGRSCFSWDHRDEPV